MQYSWIRGQAILEQGNCRALLGDSGLAQRDMARALVLVRSAGYRDLELRSAGILANAQTSAGNLLAAWNLAREAPIDVLEWVFYREFALSRSTLIWCGRLRALRFRRRHMCLRGLRPVAVSETPRRRIEAITRGHLAELAVEVGAPGEAKAEFEQAGKAVRATAAAVRSEIPHFGGDFSCSGRTRRGRSASSRAKRLEEIRPVCTEGWGSVGSNRHSSRFSAIHSRLPDRPDEAEAAYRRAIDLSEHQLGTLRGFRERAQLMLSRRQGLSRSHRAYVEPR